MIRTSRFRAKVERAAKWFDKNHPDWFTKVPLSRRFRIDQGPVRAWNGRLECGCVTSHIGVDWTTLPDYVADVTMWGNMDIDRYEIPTLQKDWEAVLRERKQKARAAR